MSGNTSKGDVKTCNPGECKVVMQAIVPRILFLIHVIFSVVFTVQISGNKLWWLLGGIVLLQIAELVYILKKRQGDEWHHFCVSIFLLVCGVVPCVWVIELHRLHNMRDGIAEEENKQNVTTDLLADITGDLSDKDITIAIEQSFIFLLIIGRWALPKGQMSRKQLSQIVLKYLAIGADVVELFEILEIQEVIEDVNFTSVILGVYSLSLLQFTFVITRFPYKTRERNTSQDNCSCCYSEIFEIVVAMVFLDCPFFCVRLVSIIGYGATVRANYFFAVKNGLFIMLYIYSLIVISCSRESGSDNTDDRYGRSEFTGTNARPMNEREYRPDISSVDAYDDERSQPTRSERRNGRPMNRGRHRSDTSGEDAYNTGHHSRIRPRNLY